MPRRETDRNYALSQKERDKIAHDALLREVQTMDHTLESHASIMTVLITGLFYLALRLNPGVGTYALSMLGFGFSLEMFLHTYRLRDIAHKALLRLGNIEDRMRIDTSRKPTTIWGVAVPKGSTLILIIASVFMAVWVAFVLIVSLYGRMPSTSG